MNRDKAIELLYRGLADREIEAVEQILDEYPDLINHRGGRSERSPLLTAIHMDSAKMAFFLLSRGADVNAKDATGRSALHIALHYPDAPPAAMNEKLILALANAGADVEATWRTNDTPLHCAINNHVPPEGLLKEVERGGVEYEIKKKTAGKNTGYDINIFFREREKDRATILAKKFVSRLAAKGEKPGTPELNVHSTNGKRQQLEIKLFSKRDIWDIDSCISDEPRSNPINILLSCGADPEAKDGAGKTARKKIPEIVFEKHLQSCRVELQNTLKKPDAFYRTMMQAAHPLISVMSWCGAGILPELFSHPAWRGKEEQLLKIHEKIMALLPEHYKARYEHLDLTSIKRNAPIPDGNMVSRYLRTASSKGANIA